MIFRLLLLFALAVTFSAFVHAQCDSEDWQILQQLYVDTDGANWNNNSGWYQVDPLLNPTGPASNCDLSTLHGVVLNADDRVTSIDLNNNNLTGNIPVELGDMVNLSTLHLNGNNLSGDLPPSFAYLTNLTQFDISDNNLTGCYAPNLVATDDGENNLLPGGTTYTRPTSSVLVVPDFDPLTDKINVGTESIHTQIVIDGPDGLTFQNMFNPNAALILEGIFLKDLKWFNFDPIADAHLQQDLSATLAYENCTGLSRPNTVYIRSHQPGLVEEVAFDPATDKISFFYLCVRGDEGVNFMTEQTPAGARFFSPFTGQSLTLSGVQFSDLNSSHFEFRANQLEDNLVGRIDLDVMIPGFQVDNDNVFNGKSVPMAGGVDQAPYHQYTHPPYTGTPICELSSSVLCDFSNAFISDGNSFDFPWEDFCTENTGACEPPVLPEPPTVTINSPYHHQMFQVGSDVTVTATATDSDGTITQVEMTADGNTIPLTNTSGDIYEGTWTPTTAGMYTIVVTATDSDTLDMSATTMVHITNEPPPPPPPADGDYNYGEVLQKSLFFYEAQQSGPLPEHNRVHWRGDSAMGDSADSLDLTGGWFDAGDHVKFGFPMAYSATMLAWSGVEDEAAYNSIQQWDTLLNSLKFVNDYFLKCHVRNADGSTEKFYGQVGNGSADHAWWGPAEVMQMPRPAYFVDAANPGSDLTGETAAAMAAASMIFAQSDPAYSALLLDNAVALYNFADTYRGKYSDAITDATAFYNSWSGYQDELVWGAIWLYRATGDQVWLDKATAEYAFLSTEAGSNVPSYHWTLAWDDKSYGCYALMAQLTGQQNYKDDTERWLDYWSIGYNGEQINYSPGGQAHLSTWGSLRYAANTSFVALIYADVIAASDPTKSQAYVDFATGQINYALGDNPNNRSYVCGFGNNPPINPHHRTAHGSWANSIGVPVDNRHILYGALVGGPGAPDDQYTDDRGDYISNEVATDYNAGFTGAIANLLGRFGGTALPDFPQPEPYDVCEEYFNAAKINTTGSTFTEAAIWATNHSTYPATETDQVCYRYFADISEGIDAGYTASDYIITINAAPNGTTASPLTLWDSTMYYVEVCFPNINIYPGGQSESRKEAQLRIALPNDAPASAWDASNDWSYFYAEGMPLDDTLRTNPRIPFYNDGELLCGNLPPGGDQNTPPVAYIYADPTSGYAPLSVTFDGTGSTDIDGDTLTYLWNFGNGHTHTGAVTGETFDTPGIYVVTLTIDDGNGGTDTETVTITVIDPTPQPPTAVLLADPTSGGVPLTVAFDGTNSADPNGDALTYFWDFGDGNTSTMPAHAHTYTAVGTYTATLTVDDGNGGTDTASVVISVTNTPPTAEFTATPIFGQPPLDVTFDASASVDPNGDALTYTWDFGDGNTATGVTTNHLYPNEGSYTVTLTVADGNGGTDTFSEVITVSLSTCNLQLLYKTPDSNAAGATDNQIRPHFKIQNTDSAPVALQDITLRYWYTKEGAAAQNAWVDYATVGNANVTTSFVQLAAPVAGADYYLEVGFTAGAGSIPAGGDSGEIQTRLAKTDWSNFAENDDWSYNINAGTYQIWDKVTVYCNGNLAWGIEPTDATGPSNTPPVADLTATPTTGTAPLNVTFDASASTDADGDALTYTWDFGDGNTATGISPNHVYTAVGTYTATLTVSDGTASDSQTTVITVTEAPQPPVAQCTANPTTGTTPLLVNFDASASSDPNGDALTYTWDFGDGNTGTGVTTTHTYVALGNFTATLTVSDGTFTDSHTVTITVNNAPQLPVAVINADPTTGTAPLNVNFDGSASYDPNGDALTYTWNFGDGNTATGSNPSHTFTAIGTYTVILTVEDGNGGTDTATLTIVVNPAVPNACFTATPMTGTAPLAVAFDAACTTHPTGATMTYDWNFGDGNTATGLMTNHVYVNVGTYTATLTVDDGNGGTATFSETITVNADNGGGGGACDLVLKYRTFDNDANTATDNQIRPHFIVENTGGTAINLHDITIRYWYTKEGSAAQNAWIDYAQIGSNKVTTNFAAMSNPTAGADHYFEVGFTADAGTIAAGGNSGQVQARFAKTNWSGYDENDDWSYNMSHNDFIVWENVTVYCNGNLAWGTEPDGSGTGGGGGNPNTPPVAAVTANPTTGTAPLIVQFDAGGSTDADGDALTYTWDFGDGNTATGSSPNHTYTTAGTFTATVTANDGNSGTDTESVVITVTEPTGGGGDIEVVFTVDNVWNTGYCTTVEIFNNTGAAIDGWTLDFTLHASIDNLWNADWSNTGGDNYTASNLSWNAVIPAGGSRTFGYCATHNGTVNPATNGVFNGAPTAITFVNNHSVAPLISNHSAAVQLRELSIQPTITNYQTTLKYELPSDGRVLLQLFDQTGRLVRTIAEEVEMKGVHSRVLETAGLLEGIYFVRLMGREVSFTERLIVVR